MPKETLYLFLLFTFMFAAADLKAAPDTLTVDTQISAKAENEADSSEKISTEEKKGKGEVLIAKEKCKGIRPIQYITASLLLALMVLSVIFM